MTLWAGAVQDAALCEHSIASRPGPPADSSVQMRLVEVEEVADGEALPLVYDPAKIEAFWSRRPVAVTTRILQVGPVDLLWCAAHCAVHFERDMQRIPAAACQEAAILRARTQ